MIPLLREGFEPPQGLSYKRLVGRMSLYLRVRSRVFRFEVSKEFPWIGVATLSFGTVK